MKKPMKTNKRADDQPWRDPDFRPNGVEGFYSAQELAELPPEAIEALFRPLGPKDVPVVWPPELGPRPDLDLNFVDEAPEEGDYLSARKPAGDRSKLVLYGNMRPQRGPRGARWSTKCSLADVARAVGKYLSYAETLRSARKHGLNPEARWVAEVLETYVTRQSGRRVSKKKLGDKGMATVLGRVGVLQRLVDGKRVGDLDDLTVDAMIERAKAPKPLGLGLSHGTVTACIRALKSALSAVLSTRRNQYVPEFEPPRDMRREPTIFTPDEIDRVLATGLMDDPYGRFFLAGLLFASRNAVTRNFAWRDLGGPWLDLENAICHRLGRREEESAVKTKGMCPIPASWLPMLRALRDHDLARGIEYLVHGRDGQPLARFAYKAWYARLRAAGVSELHPHSLKHTCVDWLRSVNCPLEAAAAYLCTSVGTLLRTYGRWDMRVARLAAEVLDRFDVYRARCAGREAAPRRRIALVA